VLTPVDDVPRAFTDAVLEAFASRPGPRYALVLSGGPTARGCYELLATAGGIDWSLVDVYVGDERVVPPDDDDANQRLIREALLDRVGGAGSFSPMPTVGPLDECVEAYQRTMSDVVTGPGIDLIHLGMGPDGHTASLFPHHPALDAHGVAVGISDSPKPPPERISLTLTTLNASRRIVLLVSGEGKGEALSRVMAGPDRGTPASLLDRSKLVVMTDAAALPG
jgi:6-phosphogluconolactonase